jgi:phosphoadenosine phosphosulfate reductase
MPGTFKLNKVCFHSMSGISTVNLVSEATHAIRAFAGSNPVVSFSGGKDSLVALDLCVKAGIKKAVFADTTVEFEDTLRYVETIRQFYGIDLAVVRPKRSFFDLIQIFGFPSRRSRWCCEALKFGPLGTYALENGITSFVTGLRSEESRKRRKYGLVGHNPVLPVSQINPLLNWKSEDVWEYVKEFSLPINALYDQGMRRIGCWPCPFKGKLDWELTKARFPDLMALLNANIRKICENFNVGIKDIDDFVQTRAWTAHLFTQTSKIAGVLREDSDGMVISFGNRADIKKTLKLILTTSKALRVQGKSLIFSSVNDRKRVKVVVEKAINCVGCGACLSLCKNTALSIEDGSLKVDPKRCDQCGNCLGTSKLRGACLRRNYAPIRYQLSSDINDDNNEDFGKVHLYSLCSGSEMVGQIRSRVPLNQIMERILTFERVTKLGESVIVRNEEFTAIFKQGKGFMEIRFRTNEDSFSATVGLIRNLLNGKTSIVQ